MKCYVTFFLYIHTWMRNTKYILFVSYLINEWMVMVAGEGFQVSTMVNQSLSQV